ncbi:diacylglycerol kinase family protein [Candidatus Giovannonibacteria bacterium]|nr:diacylglycerol kinase family protein [Candidatus Giovannonibacteria bacterium]
MKKIIKSFKHALHGVKNAYRHDQSFRWEIWGGLVYIAFGLFFWPLEKMEISFLVLSYALILIAELINTAFERALDKLHPERHELIGISKDIASGAVLVAFIFAIFVALGVVLARI